MQTSHLGNRSQGVHTPAAESSFNTNTVLPEVHNKFRYSIYLYCINNEIYFTK